jgi:hypothetical protein
VSISYLFLYANIFHISYIWVNYNNSLTWIKAIWGWLPLLTMIPVRSQWGRYNLPRYMLHNPNVYPIALNIGALNSSHVRGQVPPSAQVSDVWSWPRDRRSSCRRPGPPCSEDDPFGTTGWVPSARVFCWLSQRSSNVKSQEKWENC